MFPCRHFAHSFSRKGKEGWEVTKWDEAVRKYLKWFSGKVTGVFLWLENAELKPAWDVRNPESSVGREVNILSSVYHHYSTFTSHVFSTLHRPHLLQKCPPNRKEIIYFPCWPGLLVVAVGRFVLGGSSLPNESKWAGKSSKRRGCCQQWSVWVDFL